MKESNGKEYGEHGSWDWIAAYTVTLPKLRGAVFGRPRIRIIMIIMLWGYSGLPLCMEAPRSAKNPRPTTNS